MHSRSRPFQGLLVHLETEELPAWDHRISNIVRSVLQSASSSRSLESAPQTLPQTHMRTAAITHIRRGGYPSHKQSHLLLLVGLQKVGNTMAVDGYILYAL